MHDKVNVKRVRWDLIYINTYLIVAEIIILVLAHTNEHFPKRPTQNFVCAFKLKIEVVSLNQLMAITSQWRFSCFKDGQIRQKLNLQQSFVKPKVTYQESAKRQQHESHQKTARGRAPNLQHSPMGLVPRSYSPMNSPFQIRLPASISRRWSTWSNLYRPEQVRDLMS